MGQLMHRIYDSKQALNDIWRKQNVVMKKLYDFWMRDKKSFSNIFPLFSSTGMARLYTFTETTPYGRGKERRPAQFVFTLVFN